MNDDFSIQSKLESLKAMITELDSPDQFGVAEKLKIAGVRGSMSLVCNGTYCPVAQWFKLKINHTIWVSSFLAYLVDDKLNCIPLTKSIVDFIHSFDTGCFNSNFEYSNTGYFVKEKVN